MSLGTVSFPLLQLTASIKENPRLRAAAEALQKGGGKVSDAVAEAVAKVEESTIYRGSKEAVSGGSISDSALATSVDYLRAMTPKER